MVKENVIIGKLIPAGTGFIRGPFSPEDVMVEEEEEMEAEAEDLGTEPTDKITEEILEEEEVPAE